MFELDILIELSQQPTANDVPRRKTQGEHGNRLSIEHGRTQASRNQQSVPNPTAPVILLAQPRPLWPLLAFRAPTSSIQHQPCTLHALYAGREP
jgi:hypothetical protein